MQYWEVPLIWMPFATGALDRPTLLLGTWMFALLPPQDIDLRAMGNRFNGSVREELFFESARSGLRFWFR